jgi:hypothetical protein
MLVLIGGSYGMDEQVPSGSGQIQTGLRVSGRQRQVPVRNILSIDGGGVFVLMSLLLLDRIEAVHPGFLSSVDLFAGTSAGAISAMIIAADDDPVRGLHTAIDFWETTPILARNTRHLATSLLGITSLYSHDELKRALQRVLGDKKLRDFTRGVLVAAVRLDNKSPDPALHSWNPCSLSNLAVDDPAYLDDYAVDLALRSAAAPVIWPVYQGHVDGGLFANDPSMLALSRVIQDRRQDTSGHAGDLLDDIWLFSVGEGQTKHYLSVETRSWGYQRWMLNRSPRFALLELALTTSGEEISQQCRMLLGDSHYYRLNPDHDAPVSQVTHGPDATGLLGTIVAQIEDPVAVTRRKAQFIGSTFDLLDAFTWIEDSDWFHRD